MPRSLPVVRGNNDMSLFVGSENKDTEGGDDSSDGGRRSSGVSVTKVPVPSLLTQHPISGSPGQEFLGIVSEPFVFDLEAPSPGWRGKDGYVHERCNEIFLLGGRFAVCYISAIVLRLEVGAEYLYVRGHYEAAFQRSVFGNQSVERSIYKSTSAN